MNSFYAKKIYIDLLAYVDEKQKGGSENLYLNHIPVIINALGYEEKKDKFQELCNSLLGCGYLSQNENETFFT